MSITTYLFIFLEGQNFLPVLQECRSKVMVALVQQGANVDGSVNVRHLELGLHNSLGYLTHILCQVKALEVSH